MKRLMIAAASAWVLAVPARADVVLSGPDSGAGSYSTAAIAAIGAVDGSVSYGGLTGVSVWNFLGAANASSPTASAYGAISTFTPTGDNGKNAILRYYLTGTGASGQVSVVSLGEIDPSFGGTSAFIAYQTTGGGLLSAPELVVPGQPSRTVTNLTGLQLSSVGALASGAGGQSTSVQLSGPVAAPGSYTASQLAGQFSPVVETVAGDSYTGVPLNTFIGSTDPNVTQQIVIAQATDGYEVVYSLAELDPAVGGNGAALLPYADTGSAFPGDGVARTIVPGDNKQGRFVSNLDAVIIEDVPEPASIAMLALGLAFAARLRPRRIVPS